VKLSKKGALKWSKEDLLKIAKRYTSRTDFQKNDKKYYEAARRQGLLDFLCAHMPKREKKWTKSAIRTEAKKYTDRTEFQQNSPGAYFSAYQAGDIEKVCKHIPRKKKVSSWSLPLLKKEAKKFSARTPFSKNSSGAYSQARKLGVLDQICSHMEKA